MRTSVGVATLLVGNDGVSVGAVISTATSVGVGLFLSGIGVSAGAVTSAAASVGVGLFLSGIGVSAGAVISAGASVGVAVLLTGTSVGATGDNKQPSEGHGFDVGAGVRTWPATSSFGLAGSESAALTRSALTNPMLAMARALSPTASVFLLLNSIY